MTEVRVTTDTQPAVPSDGLTIERLRTLVQDSHLSFLIGAGTPSGFFGKLGDIEAALTEIAADTTVDTTARALARASIQAYFFRRVVFPNVALCRLDNESNDLRESYGRFLRTLNRILLRRRSTLLAKQLNIFTTNVDLAFEVALEELGIDAIDGFRGKMRPKFDLGEFGSLRYRQGQRYEHRSEIPVFDLYKLHGSVAWRVEPGIGSEVEICFDSDLTLIKEVSEAIEKAKGHLVEILSEKDINVQTLLSHAEDADLEDLPAAVAAFTQAYDRLAIVNPEKTKFAVTVLNETYYELIRRFANELEKENSVLFVHGFSFRDEHLRDLVLRAARANPTLQIVIFAYSREDKATYERTFTDLAVKNGNVQIVAPPPPEDGEEEHGLDLERLEATYFAQVVSASPLMPEHRIQLNISADADTGTHA